MECARPNWKQPIVGEKKLYDMEKNNTRRNAPATKENKVIIENDLKIINNINYNFSVNIYHIKIYLVFNS